MTVYKKLVAMNDSHTHTHTQNLYMWRKTEASFNVNGLSFPKLFY